MEEVFQCSETHSTLLFCCEKQYRKSQTTIFKNVRNKALRHFGNKTKVREKIEKYREKIAIIN